MQAELPNTDAATGQTKNLVHDSRPINLLARWPAWMSCVGIPTLFGFL